MMDNEMTGDQSKEAGRSKEANDIRKAIETSVQVTIDVKENINVANLIKTVLPGGHYTFNFTNCPNLSLKFSD